MAGDRDSLLPRFRRGDAEAIREVSRIARRVVAHRAYYVAPDEREDLVQEAVLDIYRATGEPAFRLTRGFPAFVRSVTHRRCVDWVRRQRHAADANPGPPESRASQEDEVVARDERGRVRRALRLLGLACRRLIHLRFGQELSHREIAGRLQSTEGSIRVRVHRCIQRLREVVEDLSQEPAAGRGDD